MEPGLLWTSKAVMPGACFLSCMNLLRDCVFGATKQTTESAPHPANEQNDGNDKSQGYAAADVGVRGCQPSQRDGEHIFSEAQADVRERLG
jgi:hypothetical protein